MILGVDILAMVLNSKTCGHFHTGHRAGLLSLRRLPACEWSGEERNAAPAPGVGGREGGGALPPLSLLMLQYPNKPIEGFHCFIM